MPKLPAFEVHGQIPPLPLETWDNDGIVNTASMFWPEGRNLLVMADHLDVVGHYELLKVPDGKGGTGPYRAAREYHRYDCLRSTPRFTKKFFTDIWTGVFDFAADATGVRKSEPKLRLATKAAAVAGR